VLEEQVVLHSKSFAGFIKSSIYTPLVDIYADVFRTFDQKQQNLGNIQASLAASKQDLQDMLVSYVENHESSIARIERKTGEQLLVELPRRARDGDMTLVMPHYKTGGLTDKMGTIPIQVQKLKVQTEEMMATVSSILSANEINFKALVVIPSGFFCYGIVVGVWKLLRLIFFNSPDAQDYSQLQLFKRIGLTIQSISHLLIPMTKHEDVSLDQAEAELKSMDVEGMSSEDRQKHIEDTLQERQNRVDSTFGFMLLYLADLVKLIGKLPQDSTERALLLQYVTELRSIHLTGTERTHLVECMHRVHATFLRSS
jgi:hypothetical protein